MNSLFWDPNVIYVLPSKSILSSHKVMWKTNFARYPLKNELKTHFFQKFKKVSSRKVLRLAIVHCMFDPNTISTITSNQLSSTMLEGWWLVLVLQSQWLPSSAGLQQNDWKRNKSRCYNGPVKVQISTWLKYCGRRLRELWKDRMNARRGQWSEADKVKQKSVTSSYCSERWFYKLLKHLVYLVFHRTWFRLIALSWGIKGNKVQ